MKVSTHHISVVDAAPFGLFSILPADSVLSGVVWPSVILCSPPSQAVGGTVQSTI